MFRRCFAIGFLLQILHVVARAQSSDAPQPGLRPARMQYSVQAGGLVAGRYGAAAYLGPQATYRLTNRLLLFGGLTYLRSISGAAYPSALVADVPGYSAWRPSNRLLVQGGGSYALSPRLLVSASAWKDLTPGPAAHWVSPYAGFGQHLGQGINLRADYHLTDHLSVSGGIRVSQGAALPGLAPLPY